MILVNYILMVQKLVAHNERQWQRGGLRVSEAVQLAFRTAGHSAVLLLQVIHSILGLIVRSRADMVLYVPLSLAIICSFVYYSCFLKI